LVEQNHHLYSRIPEYYLTKLGALSEIGNALPSIVFIRESYSPSARSKFNVGVDFLNTQLDGLPLCSRVLRLIGLKRRSKCISVWRKVAE
jgi:hypothetical protein